MSSDNQKKEIRHEEESSTASSDTRRVVNSESLSSGESPRPPSSSTGDSSYENSHATLPRRLRPVPRTLAELWGLKAIPEDRDRPRARRQQQQGEEEEEEEEEYNSKINESRSKSRERENHTDVAKRSKPLNTWDLYTVGLRGPEKTREVMERHKRPEKSVRFEIPERNERFERPKRRDMFEWLERGMGLERPERSERLGRKGSVRSSSTGNSSVKSSSVGSNSGSVRSDSPRSKRFERPKISESLEKKKSGSTGSYKTATSYPRERGRRSGLREEYKISERVEASPASVDSSESSMGSVIYGAYEYDPQKADIGAPLRHSKRSPRVPCHLNVCKTLKAPEKPRIIVNPGEALLETNDRFLSIEAKICQGSNFFIVMAKEYSLMFNIPNDWRRKPIIEKLADVYASLGEYRLSHPTEKLGCMWLIKGVYNDTDSNDMAPLVNVHRFRFLTGLITETIDFNWDYGELQHGSFVLEQTQEEPSEVYSIGVFALPDDASPRLQLTDCEGTRYLRSDSQQSSSSSSSGKNSAESHSDTTNSAYETANEKKNTNPPPPTVNPNENTQKKTANSTNNPPSLNPGKSPLSTLNNNNKKGKGKNKEPPNPTVEEG